MSRKKVSPTVGAGCVTLFGLPFAGIGLYMAWKLGAMLMLASAAQGWVETPATLASLELDRHQRRRHKKDTFKVEAQYRYEYGGRAYQSDRVGLLTSSDNIGSHQRELYERLKKSYESERPVVCYVDPADPSRSLLDRELRPMTVVAFTPFAVLFPAVGFGIMGAGWYGAMKESGRARLRDEAPGKPWLWRADWAEGRIVSTNRSEVFTSGAVAAFWNLIAFPLAGIALFGADDTPWFVKLFVVIFPAIGLGLAWWFVVSVLRWREYGDSTLVLANPPGRIGGELAGVVLASSKIEAADAVTLTLTCTKTTGSGKSRKTQTLWEHKQTVDDLLDASEPDKAGVPVRIAIPADARPTSEDDRVAWELKASAPLPGPDYEAKFEAPVFRVENASRSGEST